MSVNRSAMTSKIRTCLMHHVNKGLCLVFREVVDCLVPVLAREDNFNQRRKFMRKKCTCNQASTGCGVVVERGEPGAVGFRQGQIRQKDTPSLGAGSTLAPMVAPWGPSIEKPGSTALAISSGGK